MMNRAKHAGERGSQRKGKHSGGKYVKAYEQFYSSMKSRPARKGGRLDTEEDAMDCNLSDEGTANRLKVSKGISYLSGKNKRKGAHRQPTVQIDLLQLTSGSTSSRANTKSSSVDQGFNRATFKSKIPKIKAATTPKGWGLKQQPETGYLGE